MDPSKKGADCSKKGSNEECQVCDLCGLPILSTTLPSEKILGDENNPAIKTCQCFISDANIPVAGTSNYPLGASSLVPLVRYSVIPYRPQSVNQCQNPMLFALNVPAIPFFYSPLASISSLSHGIQYRKPFPVNPRMTTSQPLSPKIPLPTWETPRETQKDKSLPPEGAGQSKRKVEEWLSKQDFMSHKADRETSPSFSKNETRSKSVEPKVDLVEYQKVTSRTPDQKELSSTRKAVENSIKKQSAELENQQNKEQGGENSSFVIPTQDLSRKKKNIRDRKRESRNYLMQGNAPRSKTYNLGSKEAVKQASISRNQKLNEDKSLNLNEARIPRLESHESCNRDNTVDSPTDGPKETPKQRKNLSSKNKKISIDEMFRKDIAQMKNPESKSSSSSSSEENDDGCIKDHRFKETRRDLKKEKQGKDQCKNETNTLGLNKRKNFQPRRTRRYIKDENKDTSKDDQNVNGDDKSFNKNEDTSKGN